MVNIIKDDNQTYYGDHFVMYAIESLFYITDINIMLCQLHFNKEKKLQQNFRTSSTTDLINFAYKL